MDDREQFLGEVSLLMVVVPFALALCFFGATLAVLSGRFLFDVVAAGGHFPQPASAKTTAVK